MTHDHYCGCGRAWRCLNEACTEPDVCALCARWDEEEEVES
jgi:hypothetical protein